jgi:hypothetical protein
MYCDRFMTTSRKREPLDVIAEACYQFFRTNVQIASKSPRLVRKWSTDFALGFQDSVSVNWAASAIW